MLPSNGTLSFNHLEPGEAGAFNYGEWDPKTVETLQVSAERIRDLSRGLSERIFTIGRDLELAKALLGHGAFGPWLTAEFGWTERTAQRFLQAFSVLGAKSDTVSVLPPTTLYLLSAKSTPEATRTAIVARMEAGERPTPDVIKAEVMAARKEVRSDKELRVTLRQALIAEARETSPGVVAARKAAALIRKRFADDPADLAALLTGADAQTLLGTLQGSLRGIATSADEIRSLDI